MKATTIILVLFIIWLLLPDFWSAAKQMDARTCKHDTLRVVVVHDTIYHDENASRMDGLYVGWWMGISYQADYLGRHKTLPDEDEINDEFAKESIPFTQKK